MPRVLNRRDYHLEVSQITYVKILQRRYRCVEVARIQIVLDRSSDSRTLVLVTIGGRWTEPVGSQLMRLLDGCAHELPIFQCVSNEARAFPHILYVS